jgi:hypothetical protein
MQEGTELGCPEGSAEGRLVGTKVSSASCREETWLEFHATVKVAFWPTVVFCLISSVADDTSTSNRSKNKFPSKNSSACPDSVSLPKSSLGAAKRLWMWAAAPDRATTSATIVLLSPSKEKVQGSPITI